MGSKAKRTAWVISATVLLIAFQNCKLSDSNGEAGSLQGALEANKFSCGITKDGNQQAVAPNIVLTKEAKLIGEVSGTKYYASLALSPGDAVTISQVKADGSTKVAMTTAGQNGQSGGVVALIDESLKETAMCILNGAAPPVTDAAASRYRCVLSRNGQQTGNFPNLTLNQNIQELVSSGGEKYSVSLAAEPKGAISLYHIKADGSLTVSIGVLPDGPQATSFLFTQGGLADTFACSRLQ